MSQGAEKPSRRRKSPMIALLLQCIPLLGAASCIANGASGQRLPELPFFLWWSVFIFGLGYEHLGFRRQWVLAAIVGPVLAVASCGASFAGVSYDFEHCSGSSSFGDYHCGGLAGADRASIQTGLVVAAITLLLAVDVWRLSAGQTPEAAASEGDAAALGR
jgi:hypothetical protein